MVAYIDFFLGGDEKRLDVASTIQKRFPMCLIFGGDGSYMSPYYLHSDTLLSNLLGQVNSDFAAMLIRFIVNHNQVPHSISVSFLLYIYSIYRPLVRDNGD